METKIETRNSPSEANGRWTSTNTENLAESDRLAWLEAPGFGNEDGVTPCEMSPGKPSTRRYSQAEKNRVVRAVRQLRKKTGTDHGTIRRVAGCIGLLLLCTMGDADTASLYDTMS